MKKSAFFQKVIWDTENFGFDCFELREASSEALAATNQTPGHYSIKVDPLSSKELLHAHGFYYCDTLMETYCDREGFVSHPHSDVALSQDYDFEELVDIVRGAFVHGRFHRDFRIDPKQADARYAHWLKSLHEQHAAFALLWQGKVIGFFAYSANRIALHAIHKDYRGKGLAKFFWSAACQELFRQGHAKLVSVISAANIPVLNLYISLGFRFRDPVDVYHKFVPSR